jgi:acyl-CoA synthetase (AMP-forming)/AMP-acid ligase II
VKREETLIEVVERRLEEDAERETYVFLEDGELVESRMTRAELHRGASAVAAHLQQAGARPGDRALLIYLPGLDYVRAFYGCLYAGVIAVPAYPPDPSRLARTLPRLQAIGEDAQASLALTTSDIFAAAEGIFQLAPNLQTLHWLTTDGFEAGLEDSWRRPGVTMDDLAFLQYTSGSTGAPKGVMLTHGNLLDNMDILCEGFGGCSDSVVVMWVPPYHDLGLIAGILTLL